MRTTNILLTLGFVAAGTIPWFNLGPTSNLGIMGWNAGLTAVLAAAAGILSGVFGCLADRGMPAKANSAGPRLGAFLLSIASVTFSIVWLSSSGNTQASIGNETMLLHYAAGGPATVGLGIAAALLSGYHLAASQEQLPQKLSVTIADLETRLNNRSFRNPNNKTSKASPSPQQVKHAHKPAKKPQSEPATEETRPTGQRVDVHAWEEDTQVDCYQPRLPFDMPVPETHRMPSQNFSKATQTKPGNPGVSGGPAGHHQNPPGPFSQG